MPREKLLLRTLLVCAASLSLAACQTTGTTGGSGSAAGVASRSAGDTVHRAPARSLAALEADYKRNSSSQEAAFEYARGLRQEGYYNRADLILRPFATDAKASDVNVIMEYASIQASMGNYMESEKYARKAVTMAPGSGQAYHILGIALDAQGHHEQAHTAFKKGLQHWEGDPSPILNNLGLNLAAQGFIDEAIDTLRKALDTAPNRKEIERNLRIVSALQYQPPSSGSRLVPKPSRKPNDADAAYMSGPNAAPVEEVDQETL